MRKAITERQAANLIALSLFDCDNEKKNYTAERSRQDANLVIRKAKIRKQPEWVMIFGIMPLDVRVWARYGTDHGKKGLQWAVEGHPEAVMRALALSTR